MPYGESMRGSAEVATEPRLSVPRRIPPESRIKPPAGLAILDGGGCKSNFAAWLALFLLTGLPPAGTFCIESHIAFVSRR